MALGIVVSSLPVIDWTIQVWSNSMLGGTASAMMSLPIALILGGIAARNYHGKPPRDAGNAHWILAGALLGLTTVTVLSGASGPWMLLAGLASVLAVWAWSWGHLGRDTANRLTLPIFFAAFALPWEHYLRASIQVTLQEWTTDIAMVILKTGGYTVWYYNAHTIDSDPYYLIVNETCSGINMLVSLTMYTLIFGWFARSGIRTRIGLLAMVFPLAMLANGLRVTTIYLLGFYGGVEWADGFWHTGSAYVLFLPIFWFLFILNGFFERRVFVAAPNRQ